MIHAYRNLGAQPLSSYPSSHFLDICPIYLASRGLTALKIRQLTGVFHKFLETYPVVNQFHLRQGIT